MEPWQVFGGSFVFGVYSMFIYYRGYRKGKKDGKREEYNRVKNIVDALQNAAICTNLDPDMEPTKLICMIAEWEVKVALDPAVSEDARKLVNKTIEGVCEMLYKNIGIRIPADCENRDKIIKSIRALKIKETEPNMELTDDPR